ncbi:hypothetical protein BGW38_005453, partial [Lunasporangiospora selenospora]
MEVNRDEALRCLDIAKRHLSSGNYASARKFASKSVSLFPTKQAEAFVAKVDAEEASASSSTPSSTKSSPNPGSTKPTTATSSSSASASSSARPTSTPPRARSTPVEREYTPEQVAAVKAVRASGGDFYKVLGVKKDATETEIKKAYRK